ncbi:hypothetical protein LTR28_007999 [Elasticomyces elasticus]|nr:hypothetical protein LTR28_007999 [Elasticomyces elasticus]
MAAQAPDPRNFASSDDAFVYPIPVVRRLEQQLRNNIAENQEKLRSLVGASYRDLLGTADRIIEMDSQMHVAEVHLATIGRRCNTRTFEKIAANHAKMAQTRGWEAAERRAIASQLKVLQSCIDFVTRTVRGGGSSLLGAKVLVVARLLHKSLSQMPNPPPLLDGFKHNIAAIRRKLLSHVDHELVKSGSSIPEIVETMCAFSLVTSSAPTDVLKHFLNARTKALKNVCTLTADSSVLNAIHLMVQTLKDSQSAFPKRLHDSLAQLKKSRLLADLQVLATPELGLDIHERWLSPEVRNFTPWPRHDDLDASSTAKILRTWVTTAQLSITTALTERLQKVSLARQVVEIRKHALMHTLNVARGAPCLDLMDFVRELSFCFITRTKDIASESANSLSEIAASIRTAMTNSSSRTLQVGDSLWDLADQSVDLDDGAKAYRQVIIHRAMGKAQTLLGVDKALDVWSQTLEEFHTLLKSIKDTRWDDAIDLDDDLELESPQTVLNEDDTAELQSHLEEVSTAALARFETDVGTIVMDVREQPDPGPRAMFLLRVLREVRQRASVSSKPIGHMQIPSLHAILASHILLQPLADYQVSLERSQRSPRVSARILWEGTPPLPTQPSATTFKLLYALSKAMGEAGADLWSPVAADVLKAELWERVSKVLLNVVSGDGEKPMTNGHREDAADDTDGSGKGESDHPDPASLIRKEKLIQVLFDLLYLQCIAVPQAQNEGAAQPDLVFRDVKKRADLEDSDYERLRKSAGEYWKRTYLLFGLLR